MIAFLRPAFLAVALFGMIAKPLQGGMFLTQDIVDNGSKAYAANFPEVGAIWVQVDGVWNPLPGSGVLAVHNNTMITAAHVLQGNDGFGGGITQINVYFGSNIYSATGGAYGTDFEIHPDFVLNAQGYGPNDLAVLKLDRQITDITPASLFDGTLTTGMELSMVGFGLPGINSTGYQAFDGYKRAGTNLVDGFGGIGGYATWDSGFVFSDFDDFLPTSFEWHGSPGDSGGGWFANDGSLAAIISFGTGPQTAGNFLDRSAGAVNLSGYQPWLNDTISVMVVPEPSSFILAGTAAIGFGLFCARKRRSAHERAA